MGEEWLSDEKEEKQYMMAFIFNKELGTGIGQVAPQVSIVRVYLVTFRLKLLIDSYNKMAFMTTVL